MNRLTCTAVIIALLMVSTHVRADDAPKQPSPEEMAKMMEEWQKLMTPGEHHKKLDFFVGKWKTKTKVFWNGPKGPPIESEGTAQSQWILGKRHLQSHTKGFMVVPDMKTGKINKIPYEGMGLMGYDSVRNVYTGSWVDNMGTQMMTFKGTMPPNSKKLTMYGEMDEPMMKMYGRLVKYTWAITGKDTFTFSITDLAAGDSYKVFQIDYTRVKNASSNKKNAGNNKKTAKASN